MKIEIWSEGYRVTGDIGTAQLLGVVEADSFDEGVDKYLETAPSELKEVYQKHHGGHSIWGCQLFDNEKDARKSFG